MQNASKNITIGVLVASAFLLIIWALLFLHPRFGDGEKSLRVRFPSIDKIHVGTKVTFAGRPIGEVIGIKEVPEARRQAENTVGQIFPYELTLSLDSSVNVYDSDEVSIRTAGLMGERFIAITPQRSNDGKARILSTDEVVYAGSAGNVEDTFRDINAMTKKAEYTIDQLASLIEKNTENVQKTLQAAQSAVLSIERLLRKANELDVMATFTITLTEAQSALATVNSLLQDAKKEQVVENLGAIIREARQITASFNQKEKIDALFDGVIKTTDNLSNSWPQVENALIKFSLAADNFETVSKNSEQAVAGIKNVTDKLQSNQGTIGRLINDDDLYFKSLATVNKLNILMNDVNQYGVLFHLDKGWQRERRRRIGELARLQTPAEFKNYLDQEVQKIILSIERIDRALEKAETTLEAREEAKISQKNEELIKTYKDLLEQVQELEKTLKAHSETFVNTSGEQ